MQVREFRQRLHLLLTEPETATLDDNAWWERFGDLLNDVLAEKARQRRAERETSRCASTYGMFRCSRRVDHAGSHVNMKERKVWVNE